MRARPLPCFPDIDAIAVAPPNKAIALQCLFCRRHHGAPSNHEYLDIESAQLRSGFCVWLSSFFIIPFLL
jgi:hypothetical protein